MVQLWTTVVAPVWSLWPQGGTRTPLPPPPKSLSGVIAIRLIWEDKQIYGGIFQLSFVVVNICRPQLAFFPQWSWQTHFIWGGGLSISNLLHHVIQQHRRSTQHCHLGILLAIFVYFDTKSEANLKNSNLMMRWAPLPGTLECNYAAAISESPNKRWMTSARS